MNKTLQILASVFLLATATLQAQQIPNAGFETWAGPEGYEDPAGWASFNQLYEALSITTVLPPSVVKVSPGNGNSASAIQVKTNAITTQGGQDTLMGFAWTGENPFVVEEPSIGFPFTGRPSNFNGFYKHTPTGTDTAAVVFVLYKYNNQTNTQDSIGGTIMSSTTATGTLTYFSVPVYYLSTATPDSAAIFIYSGENPGSEIILDDLSVDGVTGVSVPLLTNFSKAFPNPAKDELSIIDLPVNAAVVEIGDMTGKTIENIASVNELRINVSGYHAGMYLYAVKDKSGNLLYMDKFNVIK